jgi:hypothetical protein
MSQTLGCARTVFSGTGLRAAVISGIVHGSGTTEVNPIWRADPGEPITAFGAGDVCRDLSNFKA